MSVSRGANSKPAYSAPSLIPQMVLIQLILANNLLLATTPFAHDYNHVISHDATRDTSVNSRGTHVSPSRDNEIAVGLSSHKFSLTVQVNGAFSSVKSP